MNNIDASYTPIDVGFDLRVHPDIAIELPPKLYLCIRYMDGEEEKTTTGERRSVIATLRDSGYKVRETKKYWFRDSHGHKVTFVIYDDVPRDFDYGRYGDYVVGSMVEYAIATRNPKDENKRLKGQRLECHIAEARYWNRSEYRTNWPRHAVKDQNDDPILAIAKDIVQRGRDQKREDTRWYAAAVEYVRQHTKGSD